MDAAIRMKMVNGRVNERSASKAAKVLEREGLTISSFIRNSLERIANTGEVPECGFPSEQMDSKPGRDELRVLLTTLAAKPMPGKQDYIGLDEDELVERLRMERYGY